jgi:uncharacterized membrane protein
MDLYDILQYVHVAAAVVWVGGATLFHIIGERAVASNDAARVQALLTDSEHLAKRFFMPASVTVLVFGIVTTINGDIGFEEPWIVGGIAGIVLSIVIGAGMIGPTSARLAQRMPTSGLDDEIRAGLNKIRNLSRIDLLILFVVVFLMVTKPS